MRTATGAGYEIQGRLVTLPLGGRGPALDGFWSRGARRRRRLLVFVHGMTSNFYRSRLKKEIMLSAGPAGFDVLSFNNRGHGSNTATERFRDCLGDIDAAIRFGERHGYREFALAGHSTGCQKVTYWQATRQNAAVRGIVLLAIGDDHAILRRDLGRRFKPMVRLARRMVAQDRRDELLPIATYVRFSARRFISIADPLEIEATLFDFTGPLTRFRRLRCPVLAVFAGKDEYATLPVKKSAAILAKVTRSVRFGVRVIHGADHGFHGHENRAAQIIFIWLAGKTKKT